MIDSSLLKCRRIASADELRLLLKLKLYDSHARLILRKLLGKTLKENPMSFLPERNAFTCGEIGSVLQLCNEPPRRISPHPSQIKFQRYTQLPLVPVLGAQGRACCGLFAQTGKSSIMVPSRITAAKNPFRGTCLRRIDLSSMRHPASDDCRYHSTILPSLRSTQAGAACHKETAPLLCLFCTGRAFR